MHDVAHTTAESGYPSLCIACITQCQLKPHFCFCCCGPSSLSSSTLDSHFRLSTSVAPSWPDHNGTSITEARNALHCSSVVTELLGHAGSRGGQQQLVQRTAFASDPPGLYYVDKLVVRTRHVRHSVCGCGAAARSVCGTPCCCPCCSRSFCTLLFYCDRNQKTGPCSFFTSPLTTQH
jgi:hypothetical protein